MSDNFVGLISVHFVIGIIFALILATGGASRKHKLAAVFAWELLLIYGVVVALFMRGNKNE